MERFRSLPRVPRCSHLQLLEGWREKLGGRGVFLRAELEKLEETRAVERRTCQAQDHKL